MNKKIVLISSILLLSMLAAFSFFYFRSPSESIMVGVYYYVWYNGTKHDNVVDEPLIGWPNYWSNSSYVIKKHLKWFQELDLDFIIISWWGFNTFTDDVARKVFETVKNESLNLKIAIMVEPFNETGTPDAYNYTEIYNYIYENYVSPYPSIYMQLNNRPLICFFNGNLTKNLNFFDNRYETRIVGSRGNQQSEWIYDIPTESPTLCVDGEINVIPRYDISHWKNFSKPIDQNLTEGIYDKQWNKVLNLARQGKVRIVTITSWNEYAERTQIEPSWDKTSSLQKNNPFYLYNKTQNYIKQLRNTIPGIMSQEAFALTIIVVAIEAVLALLLLIRLIIRRKGVIRLH